MLNSSTDVCPNGEFLIMYTAAIPLFGVIKLFAIASLSIDSVGTLAHPEIEIVDVKIMSAAVLWKSIFVITRCVGNVNGSIT